MSQNEFRDILATLERGERAALRRGVGGERYTRVFAPRERLILLGGGHVSRALAEAAEPLGFAVTVVDDRPAFANGERFPTAERVVCDAFVPAIRALGVRGSDYVCILTRGHRWDRDCLCALLGGTEPYYLGMIGSKRRVGGLFAALTEEGFDRERLARVHAPIGLMIGAVTPEEIAVSICAQLIERRHEHGAASSAADGGTLLTQTNVDYAMLRFLAAGEGAKALCLVLETHGSVPVGSGAAMAVDAQGGVYGTVGGGCGEAEVILRARALLGTGRSDVIEVDMTGDAAEEDGLVCGGTMKIYVEDLR